MSIYFKPSHKLKESIDYLEKQRQKIIEKNPKILTPEKREDRYGDIFFFIMFVFFGFVMFFAPMYGFVAMLVFIVSFSWFAGKRKNDALKNEPNPLDEYRDFYKQNIILPLLKNIDEDIVYEKDKSIAQKYRELIAPKIIGGEDLIRFSVDGVRVDFGELISKANVRYGLCVAKFNKNLNGCTYVLARGIYSDKTLPPFVKQEKKISSFKCINLDNQLFNDNFEVYTNDEIEARFILTHTAMEQLLCIENSVNFSLFLFKNNKITFTTRYQQGCQYKSLDYNLLDFTVYRDIYFQALKHHNIVSAVIETIKIFHLDSRVWK